MYCGAVGLVSMVWLNQGVFRSKLPWGVGGGGFTDAAQCDIYLPQNASDCVPSIKIRKSMMQGRKEWCCPSVSDSEVSLGSLHNRKVKKTLPQSSAWSTLFVIESEGMSCLAVLVIQMTFWCGAVPLTIGSGSKSGSDSFLQWLLRMQRYFFLITCPQAHYLQS
jgi:hypothetical protein